MKAFSTADLTRPIQAFNIGQQNLSAFAATSDCSQVALGFTNGTLLLYSFPFLKEVPTSSR